MFAFLVRRYSFFFIPLWKKDMENSSNAVLIHNVTLADIEQMVCRVMEKRMDAFYERIRQKPPTLIRRKDAARMIGVSLPTIDKLGKHGILRAHHLGGLVFYEEDELNAFHRR